MAMPIELSKQDIEAITPSLQKFLREEFDQEFSEMRTRHLLDFVLKEIGPFAYNRGVQDAESYFRAKVEDLTAICYEDPLTYWVKKKK